MILAVSQDQFLVQYKAPWSLWEAFLWGLLPHFQATEAASATVHSTLSGYSGRWTCFVPEVHRKAPEMLRHIWFWLTSVQFFSLSVKIGPPSPTSERLAFCNKEQRCLLHTQYLSQGKFAFSVQWAIKTRESWFLHHWPTAITMLSLLQEPNHTGWLATTRNGISLLFNVFSCCSSSELRYLSPSILPNTPWSFSIDSWKLKFISIATG